MAKKKLEDMIVEDAEKEPEELIEEESNSEEELAPQGEPFIVYRIAGNELILEDARGNGVRIPLPEEYKNAKKGDIIYL